MNFLQVVELRMHIPMLHSGRLDHVGEKIMERETPPLARDEDGNLVDIIQRSLVSLWYVHKSPMRCRNQLIPLQDLIEIVMRRMPLR